MIITDALYQNSTQVIDVNGILVSGVNVASQIISIVAAPATWDNCGLKLQSSSSQVRIVPAVDGILIKSYTSGIGFEFRNSSDSALLGIGTTGKVQLYNNLISANANEGITQNIAVGSSAAINGLVIENGIIVGTY